MSIADRFKRLVGAAPQEDVCCGNGEVFIDPDKLNENVPPKFRGAGLVVSQNGWAANNRQLIAAIDVPGGRLAVRIGDVTDIFRHLVNRFHNEVEPLVWPGNWGYAERVVRGGTDLSNHASGTAIDLNAPAHPLGTEPTRNFTAAQIAKIHEIVNYYEGVIRWGGDYVGRKDGMHFEIDKNAAETARIAEKVRGGVAPAPAPAPAPVSDGDIRWIQERLNYWGARLNVDGVSGPATKAAIVAFQKAKGLAADGIVGPITRAKLGENRPPPPPPAPVGRPVLRRGSKGEPVRQLQAVLKKNYPAYAKNLTLDGDFGPATERVVKEFQRRAGLTADGIVGPATYRALGM